MIELKTSYTFSQIPFITNEALDSYAEEIVADFSPESLSVPSPVDVETLVKEYIGLKIQYENISHDKNFQAITLFNDGYLQVINEETGLIELMEFAAGTVVIDKSLTEPRYLARLRFTMMHEGAHWLLHRKAFAANNPFGQVGIYENQSLAAKEGRIDYKRRSKIRNDMDRIEHQADFLAASILMPRPAMMMVFESFLDKYGIEPRRIIRWISHTNDYLAAHLPIYAEGVFNVSRRAAKIRLEKLGVIV